ncbi:hypothetical protein [Demequina flava]|uniref:hypothetical protein n=1 Tax=Demequina flava TaxID=1095025 RepID=UPI0007824E41|nr:hypothetical protein [Demequina flava]
MPIVALVLGVIALLTSFLGAFAFVSWLFALPAFVFGLIALIKKAPRKGLSITALILSVVAFLISIIVFLIAVVGAVDDAIAEDEANSVSGGTPTPEETTEDSADDSTTDDSTADSAGGETDDSGSDASVAGDATPLELAEVTAWFDEDFESWEYLVLIDNTNTDYAWIDTSITIEAFDADGVLLADDWAYETILPDSTSAITGTFYDAGTTEVTDVQVIVEDEPTDVSGQEIGSFTVSEPELSSDDWSSTAEGTVSSTFVEDQESVQIIAVARNASGEVITTDWDLLNRVPAGGTARYEVSFWDVLPDDAVVEVYAQL